MTDEKEKKPGVVIVHVREQGQDPREAEEDQAEILGLAEAVGWEVLGSMDAILRDPTPAYLLGSGKAEEVARLVEETGAEILLIDAALSPTQQRNWDRISGAGTVDRQGLILEIFADRALTREAQLQVGLARMQYLMPRLANSYTDLSRQRGGARGTRGSGETQIELDRRKIQEKIHRFKELLEEVRARRQLTRRNRTVEQTPTLALVGYTNAGKSTLQGRLCDLEGQGTDALFATLDPSARQLALPGGQEAVVVDTVGFIRKLPHNLVEAFKSTLEESVHADVLLHVLDLSNPFAHQQYHATREVLDELGAQGKPEILVLNKVDRLADPEAGIRDFTTLHGGPVVAVSSLTGQGCAELLDQVEKILYAGYYFKVASLGHRDGKILSWLYDQGAVKGRIDEDHGPVLLLRLNDAQHQRLLDAGVNVGDHDPHDGREWVS